MTETAQIYDIRTYEEGYENLQAELGKRFTADRFGFNQTPAETLKDRYSTDDFDPSSKLYAFSGEDLVGFLTIAKLPQKANEQKRQARLEFPIVDPGHAKAADQLMEAAHTYLVTNGIEEVLARASERWPGTHEYGEKYGFGFGHSVRRAVSGDVNQLGGQKSKNITSFSDEDKDEATKFMTEIYQIPIETVENQFKFIESSREQIVDFYIYRKGGEIHNLIAPIRDQNNETVVNIPFPVVRDGNEEIRAEVFDHIVAELKERGFKEVNVVLFGDSLSLADDFIEKGYTETEHLQMLKKTL